MEYGKAIKTLRAARNMKQSDLATNAKLDTSYVSLVERGLRTPSTKVLERISKALQVPFYLLVLLASDPKDLRVRKEKATAIGNELLHALISTPVRSGTHR